MFRFLRLAWRYTWPIVLAAPVCAQTFDFESQLSGWSQVGEAFNNQPFCGPMSSTLFAPIKVGGRYWKDQPFPVGQQGRCLVTSIAKPSRSTGSLTSPAFSLRAE